MRIPSWALALCCVVFVMAAALPAAWAAASSGMGAFSDTASVAVGASAPVGGSALAEKEAPVAKAAPLVAASTPAAVAPAAPAPDTSKRVPLPWYVTGMAGLTFQASDIKGSQASANEYGMNDTGPRATVIVDMGNGEYVGSFEGSGVLDMQPRKRDQGFLGDSYDVKAAMSRVNYYKLSAYRNIINHNLSDGKTTMTSSVGSTTILPSTSSTDPITHFTFNRRRINTGVEGEFSWDSPFFVNVRYDQQKVDGILPKYYFASNNGVFGTPVNFQVDVVSVQAGIRTKAVTALVDASMSNLSDSVNWLYGRSGTGGTPPATYAYNYSKRPITPSSMGKYGASLAWRLPEWATTLQMRISQSHLTTGDYDTNNKYGSSMFSQEQVYTDAYSGSIINTYAAASVSTSPFKGFTSRVYVNYHNRDNQSSLDWQTTPSNVDNRQSDYNKLYNGFYSFSRITSGLDLSYRITPDYKVSSGYEFYQMDRSRYTFGHVPYTIDNKVWGQVDAELTDWLATRLKYQFLDRNSAKDRYVADGPVTGNQAYVNYMSPADSASKNQHMLKLSFDLSLFKDMGLTLEYALKQDNYTQKQPLGMDSAIRHDFHADANYRIGPVTMGAYGGVEFSKYNANYRAYNYNDAGTANPNLPPTDKAYNWDMKQQDTAYVFGASVEWDIKPKTLKLKLAYDAERADGRTDIGTQIPLNAVESINPVDRYQRDSLEARLTWAITETQSLGVGYRYEHLNYQDWAYEGLSASATDQSYYGVQRSFDIHTGFMTYQYTF